MPAVSVIVPVYNTEKYLPRCLDSLVNQTLRDIEIICINDCSPDGSLEILRRYAAADSRVKIIDFAENRGAAAARNAGIDAAQGEYVGFVDSDDWVDGDFYEILYSIAIADNLEIIKGADVKLVYPDGGVVLDAQNYKIKQNKIYFYSQYTSAIYLHTFLLNNKINFPTGMLVGEDPVFLNKAIVLVKRFAVVDKAQYYYVRHENSLNSDYWNNDKINDYIKYVNIAVETVKFSSLDTKDKKLFYDRLLADVIATETCKINFDNRHLKTNFDNTINRIRGELFDFPVKLLLDVTELIGPRRGMYWVVVNLLNKLCHDKRFDVTLWTRNFNCYSKLLESPFVKDMKYICSQYSIAQGTNTLQRVVTNKKFDINNYDAYFNCSCADQLALGKKPIVFNFLHDTIPMFGWFDKFKQRENFRAFYDKLTEDIFCFCNSEDTLRSFMRFFDRLDSQKMCTSYLGPMNEFTPLSDCELFVKICDKYHVSQNTRKKYVFYMGAVDDSRKNLPLAIEAFFDFIEKDKIADLFFYIAGKGGDTLLEVLHNRLGKRLNVFRNRLVLLDYIAQEDANILFSHSLCFCFPSLYEGFGMPVLEAMSAGTPVITTSRGSLAEVAGNAALLVDPENKEELVKAYSVIYYHPEKRQEFINKGLAQASKFSWDRTYHIIAEKMISVLSGQPENFSNPNV